MVYAASEWGETNFHLSFDSSPFLHFPFVAVYDLLTMLVFVLFHKSAWKKHKKTEMFDTNEYTCARARACSLQTYARYSSHNKFHASSIFIVYHYTMIFLDCAYVWDYACSARSLPECRHEWEMPDSGECGYCLCDALEWDSRLIFRMRECQQR